MKELHLTLQIRNNLLRERRVSRGLKASELCRKIGISQNIYSELERMQRSPFSSPLLNICRVTECDSPASRSRHLLCRKHKNIDRHRLPAKRGPSRWISEVLKIAEFYCCDPVVLFTADILCLEKIKHTKTVDVAELAGALLSSDAVHRSLPPDVTLEGQQTVTAVEKALKTLTPREERIVARKFGLLGENPTTLEEIGREFDIGRVRTAQIEIAAMRKLRHPSNVKNLKLVLP